MDGNEQVPVFVFFWSLAFSASLSSPEVQLFFKNTGAQSLSWRFSCLRSGRCAYFQPNGSCLSPSRRQTSQSHLEAEDRVNHITTKGWTLLLLCLLRNPVSYRLWSSLPSCVFSFSEPQKCCSWLLTSACSPFLLYFCVLEAAELHDQWFGSLLPPHNQLDAQFQCGLCSFFIGMSFPVSTLLDPQDIVHAFSFSRTFL